MTVPTITDSVQTFSSNSTSSIYSQLGMAFFSVIAIILCLGWIIKRIGWKKSSKQFIEIKAIYNISAKERILLVHVDNQLLVVGVTAQQMTLLHTISEQKTEMLLNDRVDVEQISKNNLFKQLLQSVLNTNKKE